MKNAYLALASFVTVASMFLSACAPSSTPAEAVLPPGDVNNIPGQSITTVQLRKTFQQQYENCNTKVATEMPAALDNELFGEDALFWYCGSSEPAIVSGMDIYLVPAVGIAKLTPIPQDDIVFYGIAIVKGATFVIVATATAIGAGEVSISWQMNHSNRDHSPNLANSAARNYITAFLAAWTAYTTSGGPDPRQNCGILKDGLGNVVKVAFLFYDVQRNVTVTLWYWAKTPGNPWGGAYPKDQAGKGSFESGPNTGKPDWTWTTGPDICSQYGNKVPGLQPAQPIH